MANKKNDLIGVIGGMGAMASELFYKMVTEMTVAEKDQDHLNLLIYSDASMPDRTEAILSGNTQAVYDQLLRDAKLLENSGCDAICITCNTAHYFADKMKDQLSIPILLLIAGTVDQLSGRCKKAAILATDGTIKTGLYQKRLEAAGIEPFVPSAEMQQIVMHEIYDCIKAGKPYDAPAWLELEACVKEAGCDNAIMGCTELSVIKWDNKLNDFYTDPMEIMARRAIEFSGRKVKEQ